MRAARAVQSLAVDSTIARGRGRKDKQRRNTGATVLVVTSKRDFAGSDIKTTNHPRHLTAAKLSVIVVIGGNTVQSATREAAKGL